MKSNTAKILGIVLMAISFLIGSFNNSLTNVNLDLGTTATLFLFVIFVLIVLFLQFKYYTKHKDIVDKANKNIPNIF
ncbi:hypothetical protein [Aliarcobacter skirrowii]|uniref:hypothetical protein n=1 Tax=Aliarcobacter skirrowii TaxID=28200 RepID=UPI00082E9C27|nr:hypothetical protein [Aliarcobacter skirrowii]